MLALARKVMGGISELVDWTQTVAIVGDAVAVVGLLIRQWVKGIDIVSMSCPFLTSPTQAIEARSRILQTP